MARNSRFRSTSGPSSNRPRTEKGKSFRKDSGDKPSFRKKTDSRDKNLPFSKYRRKEESPETGSERETGREKSGDFARRRQFSKTDGTGKSGTDEGRGKSFSRPREEGPSRGQAGSSDRSGVRPFSKEGFKRRPAGGDSRVEKKSSRPKDDVTRSVNRAKSGRNKLPAVSKAESSGTPGTLTDLIRLNKFISNSGVCSRREADDLITMGLITVNGKSITELGYKVKITDDVRYEGRRLKAETPVYILLNKPKGYITTTDDPQERNTVMQLIQGACKERVYPVGRLDRNTSGLLLLTNDGDLTDKLTHPSYNVKKIYKAELNKALTKADFQKIIDGVRLDEGKAVVDDLAIISDDSKTIGLEIHIGWNRVIRRIFEALDYEVIRLDRSVYATLDKKDLPRGHWRFLRQDEVIRLKHFQ